jgi:peptidoglycan L-alanyl-D-glutamate endopeptidase CwlK
MFRKRYRTTRSFLSIFVFYQIAFCVLAFSPHAETSIRIESADGVTSIGELYAPGADARPNTLFYDAYAPGELAGVYSDTTVISQLTPAVCARMFPAASRANIEKYLPLLRRALVERGLVDKAMILMALATVRAESGSFDPISEAPSPYNTELPGRPFNKYDWRQDLGNMGPPDGARFKGRGFIQLTGRKNYRLYGALLGYDLLGNPELANAPQPAAQILAAYLKQNEPSIRSALAAADLAAARKIVNGGLNGLNDFKSAYLSGLLLIRDYENDSDVATSRESKDRRESRGVKASSSKSTRGGVKLIARKKGPSAEIRSRARKKDDMADLKTLAKKKNDVDEAEVKPKKKADYEPDEDNERAGKKKGKGFFLFRIFR